jgi:ribosome maturation factor RimP
MVEAYFPGQQRNKLLLLLQLAKQNFMQDYTLELKSPGFDNSYLKSDSTNN